jgi:hypothetical protein
MRKVLFAAVALLGVLGVMLAVPAFSSSSAPRSSASVPGQIRQLNAKLRALQTRVKRLETSVGGIKACTSTVQALTRFNGYVWTDGVNNYTTTAIDVPDTGEPVGSYFVLADPSCITGGSSHLYSLAKPSRARDRASSGQLLNGLMHTGSARSSSRSSARMAPNRLTFRQR